MSVAYEQANWAGRHSWSGLNCSTRAVVRKHGFHPVWVRLRISHNRSQIRVVQLEKWYGAVRTTCDRTKSRVLGSFGSSKKLTVHSSRFDSFRWSYFQWKMAVRPPPSTSQAHVLDSCNRGRYLRLNSKRTMCCARVKSITQRGPQEEREGALSSDRDKDRKENGPGIVGTWKIVAAQPHNLAKVGRFLAERGGQGRPGRSASKTEQKPHRGMWLGLKMRRFAAHYCWYLLRIRRSWSLSPRRKWCNDKSPQPMREGW